jgi:hypothetical protein
MPLIAMLFGGILLDLAFRGTEHEFATQLEQDFGGGEFWAWAAAIWVIGAIGAIPDLRSVSNWALGLVIVVLVLVNGGFFTQAQALITNPPGAAPAVPLSSYQAVNLLGGSSSSSSSSGGGGVLGGLFGGSSSGGGSSVAQAAEVAAIVAA